MLVAPNANQLCLEEELAGESNLSVGSKASHKAVALATFLDSGWLLWFHSPISTVLPLESGQLSRCYESLWRPKGNPWVPKLQDKEKSQDKGLAPADNSKDTKRGKYQGGMQDQGTHKGRVTLLRTGDQQRLLWTRPSDYCHRKERLWKATHRKGWVAFDSGFFSNTKVKCRKVPCRYQSPHRLLHRAQTQWNQSSFHEQQGEILKHKILW